MLLFNIILWLGILYSTKHNIGTGGFFFVLINIDALKLLPTLNLTFNCYNMFPSFLGGQLQFYGVNAKFRTKLWSLI